jgi:hypothetical protein
MKDIKELIYAAVEENAVVFQELAGGILQARAYDAIESLRPEIGASMFGEAKEMEDDEEDEEMEDEDEMDDKKKSMKEALHPNQQKIDVVDDEKIDAKDFAKLRATKKNEEVDQIDELSKKTTGSYLRKATIDYGRRVRRDALGHVGGGDTDVKNFVKMGDRAQGISRAIKKLTKEEVEQIDEIGDTPAGRTALGKLAAARDGRADWARGVAKHGSVGSDAAKHNNLADKDRAVAKKAAGKAGIDHKTSPSTNYDYDKKGGYGTDKANPADKYKARNTPKPVGEEVEGLDELSTEKLLKYREAAKKDADVKNKAWDKKKLSDEGKYKLMNRETGTDQADQKIKRKTGSYRPGILARVGARLRNEEAVNEVAMPQNQADWQALITHQIKTTGHPVATDAQFRAPHGKDETKIASLEPGKDKLHYAAAQGGTVKR